MEGATGRGDSSSWTGAFLTARLRGAGAEAASCTSTSGEGAALAALVPFAARGARAALAFTGSCGSSCVEAAARARVVLGAEAGAPSEAASPTLALEAFVVFRRVVCPEAFLGISSSLKSDGFSVDSIIVVGKVFSAQGPGSRGVAAIIAARAGGLIQGWKKGKKRGRGGSSALGSPAPPFRRGCQCGRWKIKRSRKGSRLLRHPAGTPPQAESFASSSSEMSKFAWIFCTSSQSSSASHSRRIWAAVVSSLTATVMSGK